MTGQMQVNLFIINRGISPVIINNRRIPINMYPRYLPY
jgi:hypothetical protein